MGARARKEVIELKKALGDQEFLTQDAEPSLTTLFDACNGFNKLSRLAMLWTRPQR